MQLYAIAELRRCTCSGISALEMNIKIRSHEHGIKHTWLPSVVPPATSGSDVVGRVPIELIPFGWSSY